MKYENEAIESIAHLLSSSDERNVLLGFELLKHQKGPFYSLLINFLLLKDFFQAEEKVLNEIQSHCQIYLNEIDKKLIEPIVQVLELFYWAETHRYYRKVKLESTLNHYEVHRAEIEPYILDHPIYIKIYKKIAGRLKLEDDLRRRAVYYLEIFIKSPAADLNARLMYCDLLMKEFFQKGERLDEIPYIIQCMQEAVVTYPHHAASYYNILGILHDVYWGNLSKAKEYYYKSIAQNPKYSGALNNLANILYKTEGNFEEAYRMVKIAVKEKPDNIHYLDTLACILWKGYGELEEAEKLFRAIYAKDKNHHASITGLGEVLEAQENYLLALSWYKKGLKLRPESKYKLQKIADLLYLKMDNARAALPFYKRLLAQAADNKYAQERVAEILALKKN